MQGAAAYTKHMHTHNSIDNNLCANADEFYNFTRVYHIEPLRIASDTYRQDLN